MELNKGGDIDLPALTTYVKAAKALPGNAASSDRATSGSIPIADALKM